MKVEQRAEIDRLLAKRGLPESVIEAEGWPPLAELDEAGADEVIELLTNAPPGSLRPKPTTTSTPRDHDERRSALDTSEALDGERLLHEQKWGVWTVQVLHRPEGTRVYARRYNGGPDNEWSHKIDGESLAEAESRKEAHVAAMIAMIA